MSFTEIARRYHPLLERVARRLACELRGDIDWTDLYQDGLLRAWRAWPQRDAAKSQPATWFVNHYRWGVLDGLRRMARPWDGTRRRPRGRPPAGDETLAILADLSIPARDAMIAEAV